MRKNIIMKFRMPALAALLFSMTFCVFGPLEIILSSPSEFWFQLTDVLPTIGLFFISTFGIVFIVLYVFSYLSEVVTALAFGLGLALYIQGNFLFVSYGTMDGTPIDWSSFGSWPVINSLIWIVLIASVLVLYVIKKDLCKQVITYLSLGIVGIQILTLGTLLLTTETKQKSDFYVSTENQLSLSQGHNIIVVLADGFDGKVFSEIMEKEEDLVSKFDGFTFYPDTCGTSLYSEESGITLLTGNQFTVGPSFAENVKTAYANTPLYEVLKDNGYAINVYAPEKMISAEVIDDIENICQEEMRISSIQECGELLYKMVAFRYVPHIFKSNFWYTTMEFADIAVGSSSQEKYNDSNVMFYNRIADEGATYSEAPNSYQFYWIQGPHEPVVMNRYCEPLDSAVQMYDTGYSTAQYEQAVGVVHLMGELIDDLKEKNLYNNTTIIFTADHGWHTRQNPLFMVKPVDANGEINVNTAPLSMIDDYLPTLMYYITGSKEYGNTIYDIDKTANRERKLFEYDINSDRTYNSLTVQKFPAGAFLQGNIPTLDSSMIIDLSDSSSVTMLGMGWHPDEDWGKWVSESASLQFKLLKPMDVLMDVSYHTYNGSGDTTVYYNEEIVATLPKSNAHGVVSVILPEEYFSEDGVQTIRFETENTSSPYKDGTGADTRMLSIAVSQITLSEMQYEMGRLLKITNASNDVNYFINGISEPEENYAWSIGKISEMILPVHDEISSDILAKINLYYVYAGTQRIVIRSGDTILYENTVISAEEPIEFTIPQECIRDGKLMLTFEYPDAASPAERGESDDSRVLAIAFSSMVFDIS